jgi:hypothetical protein
LATLGLEEPVAILGDDFSMGRLDPGDADQRAEWEREELDENEPLSISTDVKEFWETVSTWPGKRVAWMSARATNELCGLHELLWRFPDLQLDVVDVAKVYFRPERAPRYDERRAFAIVRDDRIVEHSLLELAKPVSDLERATSWCSPHARLASRDRDALRCDRLAASLRERRAQRACMRGVRSVAPM